jgi:hypothetical protein
MNRIELQLQADVDRDILLYVRESAQWAPVREDAVYGFLRNARRRCISQSQVRDRLAYLSAKDRGYLDVKKTFAAGEWVSEYAITGKGADLLDGRIPPAGEMGS